MERLHAAAGTDGTSVPHGIVPHRDRRIRMRPSTSYSAWEILLGVGNGRGRMHVKRSPKSACRETSAAPHVMSFAYSDILAIYYYCAK